MDLTSSFSDINEIIFTNYTTNDSNCFIFTVKNLEPKLSQKTVLMEYFQQPYCLFLLSFNYFQIKINF